MVAEIFGSPSAFKAMFDMAKALKDIDNATTRNRAVIELQEQILSAQHSQSALIERVRELEEQVANFEKWEAEKEKYHLVEIRTGAVAFSLKDQTNPPSAPHYLCANCFEDRRKSILQETLRFPGRAHVLECHRCGSDIYRIGAWESSHAGRQRRGSR